MEHEGIGRGEFAIGALAVGEEFQLGEIVVATVQPDIEPVFTAGIGGEARRNNQAVRLNGTIDS
jgi:hypothetical protein